MSLKCDTAIAKFLEGYNCAQSVLYAFCEDLRFDKHMALKMACGFGAGIGRKGEICGAVAGGIIVIGAKYGRGENDDRTATELAYMKTRALMDYFAEEHGRFRCRKLLLGCDLATAEGQKFFKENDLLNKICAPCVQSVVEILEKII